jgi:NAD(P)-dependent dehydrogenase (short-subunit alcohol dehydrogenase family)
LTDSPFTLRDRHIVVVGASSGIGAAIAANCAAAGARVSICARRAELLAEVTAKLPGAGHGWQTLDVVQVQSIGPTLDQFVADRGPIAGLVYAAGVMTLRPLQILSPAGWNETLAVNVDGAVLCCQAAVTAARAAAGQSLVLIGSISAQIPRGSGMAAYAASKAALEGAARALAIEGARRRTRVNVIAPAIIRTQLWERLTMTEQQKEEVLKRHLLGPGECDDVAHACVYLLSPASRWVTGTTLVVDGGYSLG